MTAITRSKIFVGMLNRLEQDLKEESSGSMSVKLNADGERGQSLCVRIIRLPADRIAYYIDRVVNGLLQKNAMYLLGTMSQTRGFKQDLLGQVKEYTHSMRTMYFTLSVGTELYKILSGLITNTDEFHPPTVLATMFENISRGEKL